MEENRIKIWIHKIKDTAVGVVTFSCCLLSIEFGLCNNT